MAPTSASVGSTDKRDRVPADRPCSHKRRDRPQVGAAPTGGTDHVRGAERRSVSRRLAECARLRDGHTTDAVQRVRGHHRGFALAGTAWGEPVDSVRHEPAVEVKGATYTALRVETSRMGTGLSSASSTSEAGPGEELKIDLSLLTRKSDTEWWIEPHGGMRVPGIIYASEPLVRDMDTKVSQQVENVATLPGIEKASYAMPDAHGDTGLRSGASRRSTRSRWRRVSRWRRLRHLLWRAPPA